MAAEQESTPNEPDPAAPPLPRRRFQFSLATLLWMTTVVACLATVWAMYRELQRTKAELRAARDEVQKYRDETGYLDISDPNKLYARNQNVRGKQVVVESPCSRQTKVPALRGHKAHSCRRASAPQQFIYRYQCG